MFMKRTLFGKAAMLCLLLTLSLQTLWAQQLSDRLKSLPAVKSVEALKNDKFNEKYLIRFSHPVDYGNPAAGTFEQRVVIGHVGYDRPVVLVTEGYGGTYAMNPSYTEELCKILDANLVFVEYRYFLESTPEPRDWAYLTVENSLKDLHEIRTALGEIYGRKWLSTGISKGGMTTIFYRAYFPDDVDVSVPYVAPLNAAAEDGRHEPFIAKQAGTAMERESILNFQKEVFKRKSRLMPAFTKYCAEHNLSFRAPVEDIFDYCVLEYAFSIFQWGTDVHEIPSSQASDKELFKHLMRVSGPDYFQLDSSSLSFFVQAAKELGYYGYDIEPFKPYIGLKTSKDYLRRLMIPEELRNVKFDKTLYRHTRRFLKKNDPKMVFIYGENDPWTASGVCEWLDFGKKKNMHVFIDPTGSHKARINTLTPAQRDEAIELIKKWME